jgi:UDP-N-acetylglucosamine--N-acetylmuramyl-(pentapeptide) pyrophosphoryl-undecaprenol N-acetylglucosamine transferase
VVRDVKTLKIAIASGGTGGHVYPGIAIAEEIHERDIKSEILFIGSEEGMEKGIISKERYSLKLIKSRGVLRKLSLRSLFAPFLVFRGFFQALKILRDFQPDIVISTGGYVSLPVVLAGAYLRKPAILHEQNTIPGISNRICRFFVKRITVSFERSFRYFPARKTSLTGNPVRRKILGAVRSVARQKLDLDQGRRTLLVLGGSQGAKRLNETIVQMIEFFASEGIQVIHVVGNRDFEWVLSQTENKVLDIEGKVPVIKGKRKSMTIKRFKLYHPLSYMYNIWDGLASADLVLSRAGATAIAEMTSLGLPSILVPFPYSAEGHQRENARVLKEAGASIVVADRELSAQSLKQLIKSLFSDSGKLTGMAKASRDLSRPYAAQEVVDLIYGILGISYSRKKKSAKRKGVKKKESENR